MRIHPSTGLNELIRWGRMTHICVSKPDHHCFRQWFVACSAPSHCRKQCRNIFIGLLVTNLTEIWIKIQENSFENVVCKMAAISSRPQWVNRMPTFQGHIYRHSSYVKHVANSDREGRYRPAWKQKQWKSCYRFSTGWIYDVKCDIMQTQYFGVVKYSAVSIHHGLSAVAICHDH